MERDGRGLPILDVTTIKGGDCVAIFLPDGVTAAMLALFEHHHGDTDSCVFDLYRRSFTRVPDGYVFKAINPDYAALAVIGLDAGAGTSLDQLIDHIFTQIETSDDDGFAINKSDWPDGLVDQFYIDYETLRFKIDATIQLLRMAEHSHAN